MGSVFLLCAMLFVTISAEDDLPLQNIVIEHSFDEGKSFKSKGTVSSGSIKGRSHLLKESSLTPDDQRSLQNLAFGDSLYIVRAYTNSNSSVLTGSCQALHVIASDGQMSLILNVDVSGSLIALSVVANNQTPYVGICCSTSPAVLSTMVSLRKPSFSVGPDTQEYLAKMDRRREEKLRQDQADNRSFLSKYWMYILPAVFFFILLNSAEQNTGGNSE